jgi:asparagine synthase (glutamine-hydrolysing)
LYGDVLAPETLFAGISALPPGHMLIVDGKSNEPALRRYYSPAECVSESIYGHYATADPAVFLDDLDARLRQSVQECMAQSGPIGIALSGGVDSSIVTAIAAQHREVAAFHLWEPNAPSLDERAVAEDVAKHLGVPIDVLPISGPAYRQEIARATYINEMPLWHMQCVGFHLLTQRARDRGVKVLLAGDTLGPLLGAESGRHKAWMWLNPMLAGLSRLHPRVPGAVEKVGHAVRNLPFSSPGFSSHLALVAQLVDGYARSTLMHEGERAYGFVENDVHRKVHAVKLADVQQWLSRFLHRGDRLGMAASLEYRNPFSDAPSVHLAMNMPMNRNLRKGTAKWGLKELASRYIPREISFRKKIAWDLPAREYLQGLARPEFFLDGFCADVFRLSRQALQDQIANWQRDVDSLSAMVHIEAWGRLFFLEESVSRLDDRIRSSERP